MNWKVSLNPTLSKSCLVSLSDYREGEGRGEREREERKGGEGRERERERERERRDNQLVCCYSV